MTMKKENCMILTNKEIYASVKKPSIIEPVRLNRLRWFGHVQRMEESRIPKRVIYTGCPRRNVPDFGRVFLMLKYTFITQNTYVQSWTVTEMMAREKCGLLAGPRNVPVSWQPYPCPSLSVVSYYGNSAHCRSKLLMYFLPGDKVVQSVLGIHVMYSAWNPEDSYDMSASVFVVQFNGFMSLISWFDVKYRY